MHRVPAPIVRSAAGCEKTPYGFVESCGQRWFHLYRGETDLGPDHPLHWTAADQTWNYQGAECHSTGLTKGYDASSGGYETTWAEIDVACEACHGPTAAHVAQANAVAGGSADAWSADKGRCDLLRLP